MQEVNISKEALVEIISNTKTRPVTKLNGVKTKDLTVSYAGVLCQVSIDLIKITPLSHLDKITDKEGEAIRCNVIKQ